MKKNLPGTQAAFARLLVGLRSSQWLLLLICSLLASSSYQANAQTDTIVTCLSDFNLDFRSTNPGFTQTFSPGTAGAKMYASFGDFDLDGGATLFVYDGATTQSPLLGAYNDNEAEASLYNQTVKATSAGGQLTFQFVAGPTSGSEWKATVACVSPSDIIMSNSPVTICSGKFYHPGYPYGLNNDATATQTLTPATPGSKLKVLFNSFSTRADRFSNSSLYVYDGVTTSAPLIGVYSDENPPSVVRATNPTGQLTFKLVGQRNWPYNTAFGWDATISCVMEACPTLALPETIPGFIPNQPYSTFITASPAGNYRYTLIDDWQEDAYSFNTVTGEFKIVNPQYGNQGATITIRATDANGCFVEKQYTLALDCPTITLPDSIPAAVVGQSYSVSLAATPAGQYQYQVYVPSTGQYSLDQLSFNEQTGQITGIPTSAQTIHFQVEGYNENGCYFQKEYTLIIKPAVSTTCEASGTILRETWVKVKGYDVRTIPVNTTPTTTRQLTRFEGPSNVTNEYGDRIRGYICPPTSGNYTFWIASDDNSVLYLSSDDQAATKQRIAWVNSATKPQEWTKFASQQSAPIYLQAGKKYYIESLHKEAYGDDHIAVGWQLPGGALERPIPGKRLSPFVAPVSARTTESQEEVAQQLAAIASLSAAPNPFADQTTIRFVAQVSGKASVVVYDLNGSLVKVLFEGELEEGETKALTLEGAALPSGVYLVKAISSAGVNHLKLVLTK